MSARMPEEVIWDQFEALDPQKRKPKAFWQIVVNVLPSLRMAEKPLTRSWADIQGVLLNPFPGLRPDPDDEVDTAPWRDDAKIAQIALRKVCSPEAIQGPAINKNGLRPDPPAAIPLFCDFCWRLGKVARNRMGSGPDSLLQGLQALPIRCAHHQTAKASGNAAPNVTNIRNGRMREIILHERENELIKADRKKHRGRPGLQFQIKGASIIDSDNRTEWALFVHNTFPFVVYSRDFWNPKNEVVPPLLDSPEKAFSLLDERHPDYVDRANFHTLVLSDRSKLAFYLMPMLIRADVWFEYEEQKRFEKEYRNRIKRTSKAGQSDKPKFKMPTREEWARQKEEDVRKGRKRPQRRTLPTITHVPHRGHEAG